ncbi:hypothetical protein VTK56DRAFT_5952 [Thermocarpiscus australiensis]
MDAGNSLLPGCWRSSSNPPKMDGFAVFRACWEAPYYTHAGCAWTATRLRDRPTGSAQTSSFLVHSKGVDGETDTVTVLTRRDFASVRNTLVAYVPFPELGIPDLVPVPVGLTTASSNRPCEASFEPRVYLFPFNLMLMSALSLAIVSRCCCLVVG